VKENHDQVFPGWPLLFFSIKAVTGREVDNFSSSPPLDTVVKEKNDLFSSSLS